MVGYRTAQGKTIDMASLAAKNEKVRAVGNMNVNARGDVLDTHNNVVNDNTNRVKNQYRNTITPGKQQAPAAPAPKPAAIQPDPVVEEPTDLSQEEQDLFDDTDEDIKK